MSELTKEREQKSRGPKQREYPKEWGKAKAVMDGDSK